MRQILLKQHNAGRRGGEPDAIVIHWSAGSGDEIKLGEYFKRNPTRDVSYHRGIGRAGGVAEYVPTEDTAWHAGDGHPWDDRPGAPGRRVNDRSVGICLTLLGPVSREWAKLHPERALFAPHRKRAVRSAAWERPTPAQVAALREQIAEIKARHPGILYVVGHDDVTKNKIDPGPILDGVDLGLEAIGVRWLRRRWDLEGAPWDALPPAPASTPAAATVAPRAAPQVVVVAATSAPAPDEAPAPAEPEDDDPPGPPEPIEPEPVKPAPAPEPSKRAAKRAAQRASKAAGGSVAGGAGDSAPPAHAIPEDQEGRPGAVS